MCKKQVVGFSVSVKFLKIVLSLGFSGQAEAANKRKKKKKEKNNNIFLK